MKQQRTERPRRLPPRNKPAVPAVWSQLDPVRQRQFAQGLAQLLLRYRQQQSARGKEDPRHDAR
jgi:hypothetical protein